MHNANQRNELLYCRTADEVMVGSSLHVLVMALPSLTGSLVTPMEYEIMQLQMYKIVSPATSTASSNYAFFTNGYTLLQTELRMVHGCMQHQVLNAAGDMTGMGDVCHI